MNKLLVELPEVIKTPRLTLQMPKAGYGDKVHQAVTDGYSDYVKWLNWPATPPTAVSVEEDCRKHHAEFILRDCIRYLILHDGVVVGRCAFPPPQVNWLIPQFGVSYFIAKSHRGNGYATEAAHALTLLAFKQLRARKVEIHCDAENVASNNVPLRLGFALEYSQRGGWPRNDNQLARLNTYSLFAPDSLPPLKVTW